MDTYDADPVGALTVALRRLLDAPAGTTWPELLALAPLADSRRAALITGTAEAYDDLAAELNERRAL